MGLGVISTNHYVPDGGTGSDGNAKEWFINTVSLILPWGNQESREFLPFISQLTSSRGQANFYRQIRNFVIDITATDQGAYVAALHYQVAQATSLQFVEFRCTQSATTTQQAIYAENGSGGFMSDLVFNGGAFGICKSSQAVTVQLVQMHLLLRCVGLYGCGTDTLQTEVTSNSPVKGSRSRMYGRQSSLYGTGVG